jgi:hypothetical protein
MPRAKKETAKKKTSKKKVIVPIQETIPFEDSPLLQLDEVELLKFAKHDAEVRSALQTVKEIDHKMEIEKLRFQQDTLTRQRTYELEMSRLKGERQTAVQFAEGKARHNNQVIKGIADKFGLSPDNMAIDLDSGAVKDLR